MADYIDKKVRPIEPSRQHKAQAADPVTEGERAQLRSAVMVQMWVAREARPDILGSASILARRITNATVADIIESNRVTTHLKETRDLGFVYRAVPPSEVTLCIVAD